jgi:hypothetical protein
LKVYLSTQHKEPGESACERVATNQRTFHFSSPEKSGKFTLSDYLYVTFYSHTGCPLQVVISFPNDPAYQVAHSRGGPSKKPDEADEAVSTIQHAAVVAKDIKEVEAELDAFMRRHLGNHALGGNKDFMGLNRQLIGQWNQYKEAKKCNASDEFAAKAFHARQKKDFLEEERRRHNLFQLHKWEFVRQRKREMEQRRHELDQRQLYKFQFIRLLRCLSIFKQAYANYRENWANHDRVKRI